MLDLELLFIILYQHEMASEMLLISILPAIL